MIRTSILRQILFSLVLLPVVAVSSLQAQTVPAPTASPQPPTAEEIEKSEQIIKQAITALGGDAYLNVRNTIGRGFFSPYKDGKSEPPLRFVDYIVYPDRERTEFRGGGGRLIQTHLSDKGWQYDGAARTLKDLQAAQVEDFKISVRTSVENLLRGWWRKEGGTITYAGRREAGLARRNLTVRLTYPDGFWVEHEFGAKDGLPAKTLYQRKYKRPDIDELETVAEEDRYYTPRTFDGVTALFIIDHFRGGTQTGRINYEAIDFNQAIPDSLFAKPATIKEIK